jgi:hypothetical protein
MITFYNDHLIAPEFCRLMYQTIPEKMHMDIVFTASRKQCMNREGANKWTSLGHTNVSTIVCLHLANIYYHVMGDYRDFEFWRQLLSVTYHEFGHKATRPQVRYLESRYEEDNDARNKIESAANKWADMQMATLAEKDKRLAQPEKLGAYFAGREVKRRKYFAKTGADEGYRGLISYRLRKSGGQCTITDVAHTARENKDNTALIRRLAADLAYKYTDHAGRVLYFFAYGDIPEIQRRVARYRAEHPKHAPTTFAQFRANLFGGAS